MEIALTLTEQLRDRSIAPDANEAAVARSWLCRSVSAEAPQLEDWLRYWNDGDTDLGNLRNLEHWLSRSRRERTAA